MLVLSVVRPQNARAAAEIGRELGASHHDALLRIVPPAEGAGKWANLNAALLAHPPRGFDWLLIVDDDVELPRDFLDVFISLAEHHGFRLAQPAHAFASHAAWEVTRRRPGLTARRTRFVEIGPVTAIRADAFDALLPFPDLQMGWGLDAHWGALAAQRGWKLGIIDARADPPHAPGGRLLPARRRDGGGRPLPRRAALRDARAGGRGARGVPRLGGVRQPGGALASRGMKLLGEGAGVIRSAA